MSGEHISDQKQFTDKMLSEQIFHCAVCSSLLRFPIMLVKNLGNVCCDCYAQNSLEGIQNLSLEKILLELTIPCKFSGNGCKERVKFTELVKHEDICKYHEKPCLMASHGCEWCGLSTNFLNHFLEQHADHVLVPDGANNFVITINTENNQAPERLTKMLSGKKHWIINITRNHTLSYVICDLTNSDAVYECNVKHYGNNSNVVETSLTTVPFTNFDKMTTIDLDALKQMVDASDVIRIVIKMPTWSDSKKFDEQMMRHFECPVCNDLMKPPIYQCSFGHSICNVCRPKLEKCPNCRALFGTARNYSLEGLTAGIEYACSYHHLGCEAVLTVNETGKHETACPFKPYPCPLDGCSFNGTHFNILKHLDDNHKDKVLSKDYFKTTTEFRQEQLMDFFNFQQKSYMVFDDNIFRLTFKRNSDYCFWAVEVLRAKDENNVFIYDIGIIDMRKPDRKLIRSDVCFTDTNCDDVLKKCILFPNNILASYACNGLFTYYCKISKRA